MSSLHTTSVPTDPPGAPEISGYSDGEIVRAGDRKVLTCRSRGGNPIPDVFWYKNGRQIDKKFNKHSSFAVNEYEFTVEASDNKATYECQVANAMTSQPKKANIRLRVNCEWPQQFLIADKPNHEKKTFYYHLRPEIVKLVIQFVEFSEFIHCVLSKGYLLFKIQHRRQN